MQNGELKTLKLPGQVSCQLGGLYGCCWRAGHLQAPSFGVEDLLTGRLEEVLPAFKRPVAVSIVYSHQPAFVAGVRAFVDWLAEILENTLSLSSVKAESSAFASVCPRKFVA